jgi:hypothetical protein
MSTHGLRPFETSLHRLRQSPEESFWFFGAIRLFKEHLIDLIQVALFDSHDTENEFAWHFDTLKHRFIDFTKVVYKDVQKANMSSQSNSPTWNIT